MKLTLLFIIFCITNIMQSSGKSHEKISAKQVIERIKKNVTCEWAEKTVDTFKTGNPENEVTGIVSCMFADMKVLKEAVANNCNLIITHEPTFYNHLDETDFLINDQVFNEKMKFIKEHNLIIWRFHDHWHKTNPDGIYVGMINKLGWNEFKVDDSQKYLQIKKQKLSELAKYLSSTFNTNALRIIGSPEMDVSKVALSLGASGSRSHFKLLEDDKTEVLLVGESPEWETYEYVLDAVNQGKNKAVIFLGHIHSEEAGMDYCTKWMRTFINEVPIIFIANGQPYWTPN